MRLSQSERSLYKTIKDNNGLFSNEINKTTYPEFVIKSLVNKRMIHTNTVGKYVPTYGLSEYNIIRNGWL